MGKSFKGLTQYTFNTSKTLIYHKCFKHEFDDFDPLKEKLNFLDFPLLCNNTQMTKYDSTTVIIKDSGHVTIIDKTRDVTVELFKFTETVLAEPKVWVLQTAAD